ncbi:hypothetical protein WN51_11735 [Melipona quadrifasciata]|uniref:Uncharacterized protein n=1 Tax=Melipona quadrifasciata TaxID=166423 RepID=A0A0M9A5Y2_9HYME|nr:hypothetical protein WN51_11735 [Melipona quadrifasciata]
MNKVENVTSAARIHFHIQSWYDEVEDFDSAEFGCIGAASSKINIRELQIAQSEIYLRKSLERRLGLAGSLLFIATRESLLEGQGKRSQKTQSLLLHVCCVIMPYVYSSCVRVNARTSTRENPHVLSFCAACNSLS